MILPDGIATVGGRLRWVRESVKDLTTKEMGKELAEHLDGLAPNVSDLEAGLRPVTLPILTAYGRISPVPLDWIVLGRAGDPVAAYVLARMRKALDTIEKAASSKELTRAEEKRLVAEHHDATDREAQRQVREGGAGPPRNNRRKIPKIVRDNLG